MNKFLYNKKIEINDDIASKAEAKINKEAFIKISLERPSHLSVRNGPIVTRIVFVLTSRLRSLLSIADPYCP